MRECGTYAGYQRHGRRGETPCTPCREARAQWQREYRKTATGRIATNGTSKAQTAARERLIAAHRVEYEAYYREERDRIAREWALAQMRGPR